MSTQPSAAVEAASPLVDRRLEIETPERVAVGFALAGPGSRFAAFVLDGILLGSVLLAVSLALILLYGATGIGSESVLGAALVALWFGLPYAYFVYFEGFRDGQTPGKKRLSLRVVHDGGYPITLRGAAIRNLLRIVDIQPIPTWLVGGGFILLHRKAQRVGDLAAGTLVVRERATGFDLDAGIVEVGPPRLGDEEYELLRQYAGRRSTLDRRARKRVAASLASHFRAAGYDGERDDDAYLAGLHADEAGRRASTELREVTGSREAAALVRRQRRRWVEYRSVYEVARKRGLSALPESQVSRFVGLYREVAADLARARTYGGSPELLYALERIVGAGHNLLYSRRGRGLRHAWRWVTAGFPSLVRRRAFVIVLAALLLFGPAAVAGVSVAVEPARARLMLPPRMIARAEEGADRMRRGLGYVDVPTTAMPLMSSAIVANNVQISFVAFAGGVIAGLGTILILVLNGIFFGATVGLFHSEGLGLYLWSFILPHGVVELTAISIAGGAGLWLGSALVLPGRMTRVRALVTRGREAVSLAAGVVMLLVLAGLIEGFVSPGPFPPAAKLVFGGLVGFVLYSYLALAGREDPGEAGGGTGAAGRREEALTGGRGP